MAYKLISRALQIFAVYLFLTASYKTIGNVSILQTATRTQGKVVSSYKEFDYSTQTRGKSYGTAYYIDRPIIQYKVDGTTYEVHGQIFGKIGSGYQLGQSVPLYYLPDNHSYSVIDSLYEMWYEPIRNYILSILIFSIGTFSSEWIKWTKNKFFTNIGN